MGRKNQEHPEGCSCGQGVQALDAACCAARLPFASGSKQDCDAVPGFSHSLWSIRAAHHGAALPLKPGLR